jgi:hypothetical protein
MWFEAHLASSGDLNEDARALRQALFAEGHDAWLVRDELGHWSLAASVAGPAAQHQLERALRRAGLSGYFVPLTRYLMGWQKV